MPHTDPRAGGRWSRPVRPLPPRCLRIALRGVSASPMLLAAALGHAHGQEAVARLDPLGAGILPAAGFGAAVAYVEVRRPEVDPGGGPAVDGLEVGDLVLVGAPSDSSAGHERGAVHTFVRRPGGFDRVRHLLPSMGPNHPAVLSAAERFGAALATLPPAPQPPAVDPRSPARQVVHEGALVAVGAPGRDVERCGVMVPAAGGVSLFRRVSGAGGEGGWQLAAELVAPAPEQGARFGASVALGVASDLAPGQRLAVVGAPMAAAPGAFLGGGATVFVEGPVGATGARVWTVLATLSAPRATLVGSFGASVAVVEGRFVEGKDAATSAPGPTYIAVAAPGDAGAGPGAGAVFLFDLRGQLLDVRRAAHDVHHGQPHGARYGERLAALGRGRLAIATPARGVVEVVSVADGQLVREAIVSAHPGVGFGLGLAGTAGDLLAVGAPFEGPEGVVASGALMLGAGRVHVFRRTGDVWSAAPRLDDPWPKRPSTTGAEAHDELGHALVFGRDGAVLVVTAPASDAACPGGDGCAAGAAVVFETLPRVKTFCAEGASGALEALGSCRADDGRLRFVIGGVAPGSHGALHAAARTAEPAAPASGCLVQPLHPLGATLSDSAGLWQLDAAAQLAALARAAPGTTWSFQVAWRGGHSSAFSLAMWL